jgi:hypothetical protein
MTALDEIRGRRDATVEQYLGVLDMVPASADTESKRKLLAIAARGLGEPKVAGRWIEVASAEEDSELKAGMVEVLLDLDHRGVPDVKAFTRLLLDALLLDDVKGAAVACLGRMIAGNVDVARELIEAYAHQGRTGVQRLMLGVLLQGENPPPEVVAFLRTVVDRVDPDLKAVVVDRLLKKDALKGAEFEKLLRPDEPSWVKRRAIDHATERALPVEEQLASVLRKDGDAGVRLAAVQALAARGAKSKVAVDALLEALRQDADPRVREAVMLALRHSLELTPEAIAALLGAMRSETAIERVRLILRLLLPHLNRSFPVRDAFLALLKENLNAELAVEIYDALGLLTTWDPSLFHALFAAFGAAKNDRVKAAILKALSTWHEPDAALIALYADALKSPDAEIRTWGVRGLVLLPLSEPNWPAVAAGVGILLDKKVDWDLREALAKKIAIIPVYTAATVAALKTVAEQGSDEIKAACEKAYDRGSRQSPEGPQVDWDLWYRRVEVERRSEGIFPDIFLEYDKNPEMARKILKAAMNPEVNLYNSYGHGVSATSILQFLIGRNAMDDDLARFCVTWMMEKDSSYGSPSACLAALKSAPGYPELKETLWKVLEKRSEMPAVLFRELLEIAYGGEEAAGAEFRKRLLSKTTPAAAAKYLKVLESNMAWGPAESIVDEAAKTPKLLDDASKKLLGECFQRLGRKFPEPAKAAPPPKPPGPGFADE